VIGLRLPTIDELIDVTMQPTEFADLYECVCGASIGGGLDGEWDELLCEECLSDLFDRLNPELVDDPHAYDCWLHTVIEMVNGQRDELGL